MPALLDVEALSRPGVVDVDGADFDKEGVVVGAGDAVSHIARTDRRIRGRGIHPEGVGVVFVDAAVDEAKFAGGTLVELPRLSRSSALVQLDVRRRSLLVGVVEGLELHHHVDHATLEVSVVEVWLRIPVAGQLLGNLQAVGLAVVAHLAVHLDERSVGIRAGERKICLSVVIAVFGGTGVSVMGDRDRGDDNAIEISLVPVGEPHQGLVGMRKAADGQKNDQSATQVNGKVWHESSLPALNPRMSP